MAMKVLVVDNYDSFTYNLVQMLGELGAELDVVRNDRAEVGDLLDREPDRVVVSPGPCTPDEAGISLDVVRRFPEAGVPTLGVCLGHQSLAQAFGGEVVRHEPVHGKTTEITPRRPHALRRPARESSPSGATTPSSSTATASRTASRSAREGGGVVMAIRHRELPAEGVQFHPESVLTPEGATMLRNFLLIA